MNCSLHNEKTATAVIIVVVIVDALFDLTMMMVRLCSTWLHHVDERRAH